MSVATHASRFSGFSGQSFEIQAPEPGPRGAVLVPTRLTRPNGDPVALDYLVRQGEEGGWQIVDVYLKGRYSELAIKRSEYTSVLAEAGVDELIARLDRKIQEMSANAADAG
jgi:phospholipid transport system substrate-binding protein